MNCNQELEDKNIENKSETLYAEHFFFCNTSELLDQKTQERINSRTNWRKLKKIIGFTFFVILIYNGYRKRLYDKHT